jgi:hypothetical protein
MLMALVGSILAQVTLWRLHNRQIGTVDRKPPAATG